MAADRMISNKINTAKNLFVKLIAPFGSLRIVSTITNYSRFMSDYFRYRKLSAAGGEKIRLADFTPILHERTSTQGFDYHYFYQGVWAFKKIQESGVKHHVDIGGNLSMVAYLTCITHVTYIDIRPFEAGLENYESKKGSILNIPYPDLAINSLSCLHVAEHIGLGRYGDDIDPEGTKKACEELERVLAINGNLYFSMPVGKPKTCFNAHRIHSPIQVLDFFRKLTLKELSGVTDNGRFVRNIDMSVLENADYACGLFHFVKV
jgi:hypothetical protein